MVEDDRVYGWKEIAAYLGYSERTAQNYEKAWGLRVERQPGERGRVSASKSDLDKWKAKFEAAGGEPREAAVEKPRRWYWGAAAGLVFACLGLIGLSFHLVPDRVRLEGSAFVVVDERGREAFRAPFVRELQREDYSGDARGALTLVEDIDGDGEREVLIISAMKGEASDLLHCYKASGELKWEYKIDSPVRTRNGDPYEGRFILWGMVLLPGPGGTKKLLVSGVHRVYFPSVLAVLDAKGREERRLLHSGHLQRLLVQRLADGREWLLAGGTNNSTHEATLLMLDPETFSGVVPEEAAGFAIVGPKAVGLHKRFRFPRSKVGLKLAPMNVVYSIRSFEKEIVIGVREDVRADGKAEILYHFDKRLQHQETAAANWMEPFHGEALSKGLLAKPFSWLEFRRMRPLEVR